MNNLFIIILSNKKIITSINQDIKIFVYVIIEVHTNQIKEQIIYNFKKSHGFIKINLLLIML